jgi:hypothetical protein
MGGALVGRPRQVNIFLIASGGLIAARIFIRAPHRGQARTSNSSTRAMSVNDRELFWRGWARMGHLACKHLGNVPDFAWEEAAASAKVALRRGRQGG